jgi:adenylosuccinate synthase
MTMELFANNGVHVIVDGQYGSTGKGLFASYIAANAHAAGIPFHGVLSNAGPNSGHTFYHEGEKHVLKQLPTFAVKMSLLGQSVPAILTAGAIIDPAILKKEAELYPNVPIYVHPNAAVITAADKAAEKEGSIAAVAGTRSGTGAALANKILREPNAIASALFRDLAKEGFYLPDNVAITDYPVFPDSYRYFMEVSQGFSLGVHSMFYPKVTSRECTVMQGIADARIAPMFVTRTYLVARTYPIRVGNVDGLSSGDYYQDQEETTWEAIGQTPELTTVTHRVRRVFTFSKLQFEEAVQANRPDVVLMNFMNYLTPEAQGDMRSYLQDRSVRYEFDTLYGFGPNDDDIFPF